MLDISWEILMYLSLVGNMGNSQEILGSMVKTGSCETKDSAFDLGKEDVTPSI